MTSIKSFLFFFALFSLNSILFYLWWWPGFYVSLYFLFLIVVFYSIKSRHKFRYILLYILFLIFLWIRCFSLFIKLQDVLLFILGYSSHLFPKVSSSISELSFCGPDLLIKYIFGSKMLLLFSIFCLFYFLYRYYFLLFRLHPYVIVGIFSLFYIRFFIFFFPFIALVFSLFILDFSFEICNIISRKRWQTPIRILSLILLSSFVSYNLVKKFFIDNISPAIQLPEIKLMLSIKDYKPNIIWSWWDYGYPLEYFTDSKVFVDGGSQTPKKVFMVAYTFSIEDPKISANLIRFFSLNNPKVFNFLLNYLKDPQEVLNFLKEVFSNNKNDMLKILQKYHLPLNKEWQDWLYPKGTVFLFLPWSLIKKSYWWYFFGTWDFENKIGKSSYIFYPRSSVILNFKNCSIIYADKIIFLKNVYFYKMGNISQKCIKQNLNTSACLLFSKYDTFLYSCNLHNTIVFKLLFSPNSLYPYFVKIKYFPYWGGIWEIY